jgi:hypothetical protein
MLVKIEWPRESKEGGSCTQNQSSNQPDRWRRVVPSPPKIPVWGPWIFGVGACGASAGSQQGVKTLALHGGVEIPVGPYKFPVE